MRWKLQCKHPRIRHTNVWQSINLQIRIHHATQLKWEHSTCARRMIFRSNLRREPLSPIRITLHLVTRYSLRRDTRIQRLRCPEFACKLQAFTEQNNIFARNVSSPHTNSFFSDKKKGEDKTYQHCSTK